MLYYFNKVLSGISFEEALDRVIVGLKNEGFGILTEIDVKDTFKKINIDFKKYKILGACNPLFAFKALSTEDKIGVFLPCNIVVEENTDGQIEVVAVDPVVAMIGVRNDTLAGLTNELRHKLQRFLTNL